MKLSLIVNRNSGPAQNRLDRDARVQALLRGGDQAYFTQSLEELDDAARSIARGGVTQVAVCGGDGTLGAACDALARHCHDRALPTVIPLRGGTNNTIARGLGARGGAPAGRLARARDGKLTAVTATTLQVEDRVGFLFVSGVMAGFLEEYYAAGHGAPTPLTAAVVLALGIGSVMVSGPMATRLQRRFEASVQVDDGPKRARADYLLIGAGTVPEVGLGFRPFARVAGLGAGFQAIGFTGSLRALAAALPGLARGRSGTRALVLDEVCTTLKLEHEAPLLYAMDGDLLVSAGPTVIGSGPVFRFLV